MELVLDTADVKAIQTYSQMLNVTGVTTNPKIVSATGKEPLEVAKEVLDVLDDEQLFFMQSVQTAYDGIMEDAEKITSLRPKNMYVKIPCTPDGLRAIKDCKAAGKNVLGTVVYSAEQGLLAALNGADYLAPYVNRISNTSDGVAVTTTLLDMIAINGLSTKVMGASFHNVGQVRDLIEAGIDAVTLPPSVLENIIFNRDTLDVVADFAENWQSSYGRSTFTA